MNYRTKLTTPAIFSPLLALVLLLGIAGHGTAQTTHWTNPTLGNWFSPGNWLGSVPYAGSRAEIANGGYAFINTPGALTSWLTLGSETIAQSGFAAVTDTGTLALGSRLYVYGGDFEVTDGGRVTMQGGPGGSGSAEITSVGGTASVTVTGQGSYVEAGKLFLGRSILAVGTSILYVDDAAAVRTGDVDIGNFEGGEAAAVISGQSANWIIDGALFLYPGYGSTASMTISDTGRVITAGTTKVFGEGSINIDGVSSFYRANGTVFVAVGGEINLRAGGRVFARDAVIGNSALASGGTGTVTIDGPGSSWASDGTVNLGGITNGGLVAPGLLTVSNGGLLTTDFAEISERRDSLGQATITGAGSFWRNDGSIYVGGGDGGSGGTGAIRIHNAGTVQTGFLKIYNSSFVEVDNGSTTSGGLIVSGGTEGPAGGTLQNGGLAIGNLGAGRMLVANSGTVANGTGQIGLGAGSSGAATVTGADAEWRNQGVLFVGNAGSATLNVLDGAAVFSATGIIAATASSGGQVFVRDPDSSWQVTGGLRVGSLGSGYLEVANGAYLSSEVTSIGAAGGAPPFGPSSSALVTGVGSIWDTFGLYIGGSENGPGSRGLLRIENGGYVFPFSTTVYQTGELQLGANPHLGGPLILLGGVIRTFAPVALVNEVALGAGGAQIIVSAGGATLNGEITGDGGLIKAGLSSVGEGPLTLTAANTYTGATRIDRGALLVTGSMVSATTVNSGGTLGGTGTVGSVRVNGGGALAPGRLNSRIGALTASAVSFAPGASFRWDLDSNTAQADRLIVTQGDVSLDTNAAFVPMDPEGISLTGATSFTLIDKQSAGFVSGTFTGYAEGARFDLGANRFSISYRGGDGNDVTLTSVSPSVWDSGGTSNNWSDASNWDPDYAPVDGDSLTFGSGTRTTTNADYTALSVNSLTFTDKAPAFAIHVPESGSSTQLTITGALTNASAERQTLVADGATGPGNSGVLSINGNSMSGPFTLIARGPTNDGPNGGVIQFLGAANGMGARVITEPGSYFDFHARAGSLRLGSIEGGGQFLMGSNPLLVGFNNLDTEFSGTLAGSEGTRLEKHGSGRLILSGSNTHRDGTTIFDGILEVRAASYGLGFGDVSILPRGELVYSQSAVADFQTFTARRSSAAGEVGGILRFTDTASAGRLTMVAEGATQGLSAGCIDFEGTSTAGTSTTITVQEGIGSNGTPGALTFTGNSTATGTTITNRGLAGFKGNASAGSATIVNLGAAPILGSFGETIFRENSTAGSATIVNEAALAANTRGGHTVIASDAGSANITARGGSAPGTQGQVTFTGSAAQSTVIAGGARAANASSGVVLFGGASTAANSTLIARSGLVAGATGGSIVFMSQSSGGLARASLAAGARFDISSLLVPGMTIGSIEGAGSVFLGGKELIVGGNGANTTISGMITDGGAVGATGGSLTKTGAGALTLEGINSYSGRTIVSGGTLIVTGSLAGLATAVLDGATLAGTGATSDIILESGGTVSPGNGGPGTLTSTGCTWHGGGVMVCELAADGASDRLRLGSGPLRKGSAGSRVFDFAGSGVNGITCTLATFGSTECTAADFTSANLAPGVTGTFQINGGNTLVFITGAAPTSPIEVWRQTWFDPGATNSGPSANAADPDHDSLTNLDEYALGSAPLTVSSAAVPTGGRDGNFLTLAFQRNPAATDVTFIIETSPTLAAGSWKPLSTWKSPVGWINNPGAILSDTAGAVSFRDSSDISTAANPRRFLRLRLTHP